MLATKLTQCFFIIAAISCTPLDEPEKRPDQPFFTLESGRYADFILEKTRYQAGQPEQVSQTKLRKLIGDPVQRPDGQIIFSIQYLSQNSSGQWQTDSLTAGWETHGELFEMEHGQPVVKVGFPVYEGSVWYTNTFNANPELLCKAVKVDQPYKTQSQLFTNTVTIERQDDSTLLSRKKYTEIYGRNVGLIRRERLTLQYCYSADCVGKGIISSGSREITTLQNFGKL